MDTTGNGADSALPLLVYGSLKRGMAHHRRLAGARCLGEAWATGLALYDLGPFPMAVAGGAGSRLQGELYAVEEALLAELDQFEGVPRLYERQRWQLEDGAAAWVYVGRARQVRHVPLIAGGIWRGATASRSPLLAALAAGLLLQASPGWTGDLRNDCLAWSRARGSEQVQIGNRIGREQLLTKNQKLAEEQPGTSTSLYRWSDIQQLCRRL